MRSLSGLGARNLKHRKGRSALTALGIVLGVAILFGVLVTNASVSQGFKTLFARLDGTEVVARASGSFDGTVPRQALASARGLPEVERANGFYGFGGGLRVPGKPAPEPVFVGGSDNQKGTPQLSKMTVGRKLGEGDEAIMGTAFAERVGARVGQRITVTTPTGERKLAVVGLFTTTGGGEDGGFIGVPLATAQRLAGVGDVLRSINIDLDEGVIADQWMARHRDDLGGGVELSLPTQQEPELESFLQTVQGALTFMAAIALFVGAFLIYLTLSTAVLERTRVYGTLRALGATRRQVRRTVLTEAVALGAGSTVAGLVLGLGMSVGLVQVVSSLFDLSRPALVVQPAAVAIALVAGVLSTTVASFVPARRAARLSPVEAMRGDAASDAQLGRGWMVGIASLVIGLVVSGIGATASSGSSNPAYSMGPLFVLLGAVLLVPVVLSPIARGLGRITSAATPGVGPVAVMHLVKERSRSAYTLGLVMVVLAMSFTIGAASRSMHNGLEHAIDVQFGADAFIDVMATAPALDDRLEQMPEVAAASSIRYGRVQWLPQGRPEPMRLTVIDPASFFEVSGFIWIDGSDDRAREALARRGAVLVPDRTARQHDIAMGDTVAIRTRSRVKDFTVAGIFGGFSTDQSLTVGLADGEEHFGSPTVGNVLVMAKPGTTPAELSKAIEEGPGRELPIEVQTASQLKTEVEGEVDGFFGVFWAILLVAGIVGLLGLTNTLAMSVLARYREIGVLRAVGTTRRQIRAMVAVEAATLVLVAAVLSVPLGSLLSYSFVRTMSSQMGFTVTYEFPMVWVPLLGVFALVIGGLAAVGPARRAARLQVVRALALD